MSYNCFLSLDLHWISCEVRGGSAQGILIVLWHYGPSKIPAPGRQTGVWPARGTASAPAVRRAKRSEVERSGAGTGKHRAWPGALQCLKVVKR